MRKFLFKERRNVLFVLAFIGSFILGVFLQNACTVQTSYPHPPELTEQPSTTSGWSSWSCYRFTLGVPGSASATWRYRTFCTSGGTGVDLLDTSMKDITILNVEYLVRP